MPNLKYLSNPLRRRPARYDRRPHRALFRDDGDLGRRDDRGDRHKAAAGVARARLDGWNATLAAAAIYLVIVGIAAFTLPAVDEVPATFPASLLWKFRIASIGGQALMWATIGLIFGALTLRAESNRSGLRLRAARS